MLLLTSQDLVAEVLQLLGDLRGHSLHLLRNGTLFGGLESGELLTQIAIDGSLRATTGEGETVKERKKEQGKKKKSTCTGK